MQSHVKSNRRARRTPLHSPLIPSTSYLDTLIGDHRFSLACVNIPIHWAIPQAQQMHRNYKRTRPKYALKSRKIMYALLLAVLQSKQSHQVYALPSTNHAIINEPSKDIARQRAYVKTVIHNMTNQQQHTNEYDIHTSTHDEKSDHTALRNTPHCYVMDSDSCTYLLDSGANRFIVNDAKMLTQFMPTQASVKGISGTSVAIRGMGQHQLTLKSDNNYKMTLHVDAAFVPSSPYNIIPPQLLISALKVNGYEAGTATHDNRLYTFTCNKDKKNHQLTVRTNENDLFVLRSAEGYTRFSKYSSQHGKQWCSFVGANNIIPDDDNSNHSPAFDNEQAPTLASGKTRETTFNDEQTPARASGRTREPTHIIPYNDSDLESLPNQPITQDFSQTHNHEEMSRLEDPAVVLVRRKQARLATIHERLGHLSFARLKLLARSGIIPKELANVEAPTCPGCAYGKAHRKPWRAKGIRNRRTIRPATEPRQVVSVDQLVSPTPGFVPTH